MWRVIGQDKAIKSLELGLRKEQFSHAWLFVGPRHVGKLTLAFDLACALNCLGEEKPCGKCPPCRRISSGNYPDVRLIERKGKEISIAQVKELQQAVSLKPYEGKFRVFIINDVEYLSEEAGNCFLKVLEEPPPRAVFVLLTQNTELLLPTIGSRCQKIELRSLPLSLVKKVLEEKFRADESQSELLSRLSRGSLGWAISALQGRNLLEERQGRLRELLQLEVAGIPERFAFSAQVASEFGQDRQSVHELLELWAGWWRDILLVKSGCGDFITNLDQEELLLREAEIYTLQEVRRALRSIRRSYWELKQNANPRLSLEVLMLNLPQKAYHA